MLAEWRARGAVCKERIHHDGYAEVTVLKRVFLSLVLAAFMLVGCQSTDTPEAFFVRLDAKRLDITNRLATTIGQGASPIEQVGTIGDAQQIIWEYVYWLETTDVPSEPAALRYLVDRLAENGHQYGIYLHGLKIAVATANLSAFPSLEGGRVIAEAANVNLVGYELKLRRHLGVQTPDMN